MSRMHRNAIKNKMHPVCRKSLFFKGAQFGSIQSITKVGAKFFHIQFIYATTDFFVWSKEDTNLSVFYFRVLHEISRHFHNDGHTGLIVSAQESLSRSRDN